MVGRDGVELPARFNEVTRGVIGAAIEVHKVMGPGHREQYYERALRHELGLAGLSSEAQVPFKVSYKGMELGTQVIDLVVEGVVIVECKCVEAVLDVHQAQLLGYLRFTGLPVGLLLNFHVARLTDGLTRRINYPPWATTDRRTSTRSGSVLSVPTP
ncbi:MAG: GxxExxY protein [Phycisphaerales bacterium]|nr:GxxExxY protein [Phycisphaerales bacterium]